MRDVFGAPIHFGLTRTTDASVEPLTLTDVKAQLRVDGTAEDDLLTAYIKAARQMVEAETGRAFINQTWTLTLDSPPRRSGSGYWTEPFSASGVRRGAIALPIAPVSSVTSIKAFDAADAETTVSASVYRLDTSSTPARIVLKDGQDWPSGLRPQNALSVVFVAGYGAAAANISDQALVMAVRLLVAHWHANREAVGDVGDEIALAYKALLAPLKVWA
jgi:uncharacterized phiE125 gp8 family phage protein